MENFPLFHDPPLSEKQVQFGRVSQSKLINILNYINFEDRNVNVVLVHKKHQYSIVLRAKPEPCQGSRVSLAWVDPFSQSKLQSYTFEHVLIDNREGFYKLHAEVEDVTCNNLILDVKSYKCYQVGHRQSRRVACQNVDAQLIQSGICLTGEIVDHSNHTFCVKIPPTQARKHKLFNFDRTLTAVLSGAEGIVFSGVCEVLRKTRNRNSSFLILKPLEEKISRFKSKKYRSERVEISPSPVVHFKSPLSNEHISFDVDDLSGTGFSVAEDFNRSQLFPGLIIPKLELSFSSKGSISCSAQIVYRETAPEGKSSPPHRYGFAFLDMEMKDQLVLSSILHSRKYTNAYVCSKINPDELWSFFFDSGFVYPEKYLDIHENKAVFKETYEKLYRYNNDIARYFTYQENGVIHSHISMLRFYDRSWLIQHHASKPAAMRKLGLQVLEQAGAYINDFHSLSSTNMDYVMCYYRGENRFPSRVFGGCAEWIDDKKACSIDSFAYTIMKLDQGADGPAADVELSEASLEDLAELEVFYEHYSGGLMVKALSLETHAQNDTVTKDFARIGFHRERQLFSLFKEGLLKAVLMVNVSDLGLNLSNMTNCIHTFIFDPEGLEAEDLHAAFRQLATSYGENTTVPVLIYPARSAANMAIPFKKTYNIWILSMQHTERYFGFLRQLFRRSERRKRFGINNDV